MTELTELTPLPSISINRSKGMADFTVESYSISVSSQDPGDLIPLLDAALKRLDK